MLVNNPTCIGIGEARSLWPNEQLQCVLSIGNGRSMPAMPTVDGTMRGLATSQNASVHDTLLHGTSLTDKIVKIVDSATDTESELWENCKSGILKKKIENEIKLSFFCSGSSKCFVLARSAHLLSTESVHDTHVYTG